MNNYYNAQLPDLPKKQPCSWEQRTPTACK